MNDIAIHFPDGVNAERGKGHTDRAWFRMKGVNHFANFLVMAYG